MHHCFTWISATVSSGIYSFNCPNVFLWILSSIPSISSAISFSGCSLRISPPFLQKFLQGLCQELRLACFLGFFYRDSFIDLSRNFVRILPRFLPRGIPHWLLPGFIVDFPIVQLEIPPEIYSWILSRIRPGISFRIFPVFHRLFSRDSFQIMPPRLIREFKKFFLNLFRDFLNYFFRDSVVYFSRIFIRNLSRYSFGIPREILSMFSWGILSDFI